MVHACIADAYTGESTRHSAYRLTLAHSCMVHARITDACTSDSTWDSGLKYPNLKDYPGNPSDSYTEVVTFYAIPNNPRASTVLLNALVGRFFTIKL